MLRVAVLHSCCPTFSTFDCAGRAIAPGSRRGLRSLSSPWCMCVEVTPKTAGRSATVQLATLMHPRHPLSDAQ